MEDLPPALLRRIALNPLDAPAWRACLPYLESLPLPSSLPHLRRALALFPRSGEVVLAAVRAYVSANDMDGAEGVLLKHLVNCPHPPLWAFYARFVEAAKLGPALEAAEGAAAGAEAAAAARACEDARSAVLGAYEYAAAQVGGAWGSEALWRGYAAFAAALPAAEGGSAAARSAARDSQRKALQRGATAPHVACDELWEAYTAFEEAHAPAKLRASLLAAHAPAHGDASVASRERGALWGAIDAGRLPAPPPSEEDAALAERAGGGGGALRGEAAALRAQVDAWLRVAAHEARSGTSERARGVFRAALAGPLRCAPDVWWEFISFEGGAGGGGEGAGAPLPPAAAAAVADALEACPFSVLLALSVADAAEAGGRAADAAAAYRALLERLHALAAVGGEGRAAALAAAAQPGGGGASPPLLAAIDALIDGGSLLDALRAAGVPLSASAVGALPAAGAPPPLPFAVSLLCASRSDAAAAAAAIPSVFTLYAASARRSSPSVEPARAVFKIARASAHATPALFLATARLEYFANGRDATVPRNVLEAARKRWPGDADLAAGGADFLALCDGADAARAWLESALTTVPPAAARPLWDRLLAIELCVAPGGGSLVAVAELERRRACAHPELAAFGARLLARWAPRWGVGAAGAPPALRADADFLSRAPVHALATLSLPHEPPRLGEMEKAPTSGGTLAECWGLAPPPGARDGLALQAPPLLRPCAFVGAAAPGAAFTAAELLAAGGAALAPPPAASAPPADSEAALAALPPLPSAPQLQLPQARLQPPPRALQTLLAQLPAFAPELGPLPDVEDVMRLLLEGGGEVVGGGAPAAAAGVKRGRS
jgi:hypothetical protein